MKVETTRTEQLLKTASLISAYSAFLTPWLTQRFIPFDTISFRYVFGDMMVWLEELPPGIPPIQLRIDPGNSVVVMLLLLEMFFIWLSMSRFKRKSITFEVVGALFGLPNVVFTALNFLKVGFSAPQHFEMTLMPGFILGLMAPVLLLISSAVKVKGKQTTQL